MEYTLNELEKRIGYSFQDKKLLERAMTHSSYANEHHLGQTMDATSVWNF